MPCRAYAFSPSQVPVLIRSSTRRFDLLLLRLRGPLILAPLPIAVRIRHLVIAPTALVRRVVLFGDVGVGIGLEVFVEALVVFVGGAAVGAGGDDFFL